MKSRGLFTNFASSPNSIRHALEELRRSTAISGLATLCCGDKGHDALLLFSFDIIEIGDARSLLSRFGVGTARLYVLSFRMEKVPVSQHFFELVQI